MMDGKRTGNGKYFYIFFIKVDLWLILFLRLKNSGKMENVSVSVFFYYSPPSALGLFAVTWLSGPVTLTFVLSTSNGVKGYLCRGLPSFQFSVCCAFPFSA